MEPTVIYADADLPTPGLPIQSSKNAPLNSIPSLLVDLCNDLLESWSQSFVFVIGRNDDAIGNIAQL